MEHLLRCVDGRSRWILGLFGFEVAVLLVDGIGKHPSNNWPVEISLLDLVAAKSLARHYEQHAFVWAAGDGLPELVQPIKNAPEGA